MILSTLLAQTEYTLIKGSLLVDVTDVFSDSRKVVPGSMFIAVSGANSDGHSYVMDVINKGASVVVISKDVEGIDNTAATVIRVEDTRYAMAMIAGAFFGNPSKELFTIGITGTKGKTTTTYMVKNVLEACGIKTGLIGTIETIIGEERIPSSHTTPESYDINKYFRKMVEEGCKAVVMEVSSQGLMLHRTAGINFDIGVFTNLEKDHIGPNEHTSMEQYMECKSMLFRQCKVGIVNADDKHLEAILKNHTCEVETYGISDNAMIKADNIRYMHEPGNIGTCYSVSGAFTDEVKLSMPGIFSVYNSLCAIAVTRHFNIDKATLNKALLEVKVKGRIELVKVSDKYTVIIDYAHNAMSLESILKTLKEYKPNRLVCMFGCGGNRSRDRRFEMGEVSGRYSDFTVITSDNPRYEEPLDIIKDIKTGIEKTDGKYIEIPNRKDAIKYCIENGMEGDIILLAGKGHEDYQEIKGVKYPMDERVLIAQVMEELGMPVLQ